MMILCELYTITNISVHPLVSLRQWSFSSLKTIIPPMLWIPLSMFINSPYILFHTHSLILFCPYPSSLTLSSHFQQYFPHRHGYMFGSLLSYKHVLLGHLLATSQELTFLSLFPCLKLTPSAHAKWFLSPVFHQNKYLLDLQWSPSPRKSQNFWSFSTVFS